MIEEYFNLINVQAKIKTLQKNIRLEPEAKKEGSSVVEASRG